jgi:hypothetical protein
VEGISIVMKWKKIENVYIGLFAPFEMEKKNGDS